MGASTQQHDRMWQVVAHTVQMIVRQNFVGHQPPFLALGDDTVIAKGMTCSVEPGLYDEKSGIGINPSDRLVVLDGRSVLMSRIPFTKEWSYLAV